MKYEHQKQGFFGHRFLVTVNPQEIAAIKKTIIADYMKLQPPASALNHPMSEADIVSKNHDQILKTLRDRILSSYFNGILNDLKLVPAAPVKFKASNLNESADFQFIGEFETRPQLQQINTNGIEFNLQAPEVTESLLGEEIRRILLPFGQAKDQSADYQSQWKSFVIFDLDYIVDGRERPEYSMKRQGLMLGSKAFKFPIDQYFIGASSGQIKFVDYKLPEVFNIHELAGKTVKLKLTVNKVQEIIPPNLDDNFIQKQFGGKPGAPTSAKAFRDFVKNQLVNRLTFEQFTKSKSETLRKLVLANQFAVPGSMIEAQKKVIIDREAKEAQSKGKYTPPAPGSKKDQDLTRFAADIVRAALIVDFLARSNNIKVTPMDVENHLSKTARLFGTTAEALKSKFTTRESREQLKYAVLENKVVHLFAKSA